MLLRMQKEKLVQSVMKDSPNGPKRKYYMVTENGMTALQEFMILWNELSGSVNQLLQGKEDGP